MLQTRLIEADSKLTSAKMIKQRIDFLHSRNRLLWDLLTKDVNKDILFTLIAQNNARIAKLSKIVVD